MASLMPLVEIEELLKNNDTPSDSLIDKIKQVLHGPQQEVQILNKEGSSSSVDLAIGMDHAENKQQVTIILNPFLSTSPIHRVPLDVLQEIFGHCLPYGRNPCMKAFDCPLLLTHVCHTWRKTALASSRLWARMHIVFPDEDNFPPEGEINKSKLVSALEHQHYLVKEWLSRSRMYPLSISIYIREHPFGPAPSQYLVTDILRSLVDSSKRWESLQMVVPVAILTELSGMVNLKDEGLPNLTSLKVKYQKEDESMQRQPSLHLMLNAPNLKFVSIANPMKAFWRSQQGRLRTSWPVVRAWKKLTEFDCRSFLMPCLVAVLFETCPSLVHVRIRITPFHLFDGNTALRMKPNQKPILLSQLSTLYILGDRPSSTDFKILYKSINAPNLKDISYGTSKTVREYRGGSPFIVHLLERSTKLEKLTIDPWTISEKAMQMILQNTPSITQLVIDRLWETEDDRKLRFGRSAKSCKSKPECDILHILMRSYGYESHLDIGAGSLRDVGEKTPFLPRLEHLSIESRYSTKDMTESALLNWILKRMEMSLEVPRSNTLRGYSKTATLKTVSVAFKRRKKMGLADFVSRHAVRYNTDKPELKLVYPSEDELKDAALGEMRLARSPVKLLDKLGFWKN